MRTKSIFYSILFAILLVNLSCKDDDSDMKVNEDKAYYEFTPQDGDLAGKTFKALDFAVTSTTSFHENQDIKRSGITFYEGRNITTEFLIRWNGDNPYPIGTEVINNEEGYIRLTGMEGENIVAFISENVAFTVTNKKVIQLEDKIGKTTYPAYELEGNFEGIFVSQPSTAKVTIKGKLKLVNAIG